MQTTLDSRHWRSLCWWLAVCTLALSLKYHYSVATPAELHWMLQPLADLLALIAKLLPEIQKMVAEALEQSAFDAAPGAAGGGAPSPSGGGRA